jgi:hypothetical protein
MSSAYDHPGARRATHPESGGEWLKTLPSSDEEGWRVERHGVFPQPVKARPSRVMVRNPG